MGSLHTALKYALNNYPAFLQGVEAQLNSAGRGLYPVPNVVVPLIQVERSSRYKDLGGYRARLFDSHALPASEDRVDSFQWEICVFGIAAREALDQMVSLAEQLDEHFQDMDVDGIAETSLKSGLISRIAPVYGGERKWPYLDRHPHLYALRLLAGGNGEYMQWAFDDRQRNPDVHNFFFYQLELNTYGDSPVSALERFIELFRMVRTVFCG